MMFLDICKRWHYFPLAGLGAKSNPLRVAGHKCRNYQDPCGREECCLRQLEVEKQRRPRTEPKEHSCKVAAAHHIKSDPRKSLKGWKFPQKSTKEEGWEQEGCWFSARKCWCFSPVWCLLWNVGLSSCLQSHVLHSNQHKVASVP